MLLGDLCLVWAEQMLRESGVEQRRLQLALPRYDAMRTELALGQFADLASDIRNLPSMTTVLDVARRKSGNYTVRRPLEIGAAMSGCSDRTVVGLGHYGSAIGEAFQLRDDLLGVFGSEAITGKPSGGDLIERKATSVLIAAHQLADPTTRTQFTELMNSTDLDGTAIDRWRALIVASGAVQWIENLIADRVASARAALDQIALDESVRTALTNMAQVCTERTQ
jgi:geranylgeranyl diphosphate synthase type I